MTELAGLATNGTKRLNAVSPLVPNVLSILSGMGPTANAVLGTTPLIGNAFRVKKAFSSTESSAYELRNPSFAKDSIKLLWTINVFVDLVPTNTRETVLYAIILPNGMVNTVRVITMGASQFLIPFVIIILEGVSVSQDIGLLKEHVSRLSENLVSAKSARIPFLRSSYRPSIKSIHSTLSLAMDLSKVPILVLGDQALSHLDYHFLHPYLKKFPFLLTWSLELKYWMIDLFFISSILW